MASILKRNNRWQAKIRRIGSGIVSKTFKTKENAEMWARKTESEIKRGIYVEDVDEARSTKIKEADYRFEIEHLDRLRHGKREKKPPGGNSGCYTMGFYISCKPGIKRCGSLYQKT